MAAKYIPVCTEACCPSRTRVPDRRMCSLPVLAAPPDTGQLLICLGHGNLDLVSQQTGKEQCAILPGEPAVVTGTGALDVSASKLGLISTA